MKANLFTLRSTLLFSLLCACQAPTQNTPQITNPITSNPVAVVSQSTSVFRAQLTGAEEVPAVQTTARGYAVFELSANQESLSVKLYAAGLSGPITGAHLHLGATGKTGDALKPLQVNGNTLTGVWAKTDADQPFTAERLASLQKGEVYVNIHTEKNPDGEIRGQLSKSDTAVYPVYLSASQEVPAVNTSANGVAWVQVKADRSELKLSGTVYGLSANPTGAHIHRGAKGQSGDMLKAIQIESSDLSLTWSKNDASSPFTPGVVDLLVKGELYINVQTAANEKGEIRGQIQK